MLVRLLFLSLFPALLFGQQPAPNATYTPRDASRQAQLGVTDAAQIDALMYYVPGVGSPSRQALERQSIKPYMMPVRQMPGAGQDWAYALADCLEFYANLNTNYKDNLSPDYIALSLRGQGRPSLLDGLKFLVENGTVSAAIIAYGAANIPSAVYAAKRYNLQNYLHIFQDFTRSREKVFEVRKALSRGNPVIVEFAAEPGFARIENNRFYQPSGNATQPFIVVVVGYDETEEALEVRTPFGRGWGDGGYLWIDYDDFGNQAKNGYVMLPVQY